MATTPKKTGAKKKTKKRTPKPRKAAAKQKAAKDKSQVKVKTREPEATLESRPLVEMERLMSEFRRDWMKPSHWDWSHLPDVPAVFEGRFPNMDVVDRDKEIIVKAEVPGIDKEDLEVSISDRNLTIKGKSRKEEKTEEGEVHRREIRSRSFSRMIALPADVDSKKAKASYKDGVVELTLPKVHKSTTHRVPVA